MLSELKMSILKRSTVLCVIAAMLFTLSCENSNLADKPCVVMLGDSIFALSGAEARYLEGLSGQKYRKYYVSGAQVEIKMPFMPAIPRQYDRAIAEGPIRTIILDGGGNDVLIGSLGACNADYGEALSQKCHAMMDDVKNIMAEMLVKVIDDGVKDVVFQGYYYVNNKKLWQVTDVFQENMKVFVDEMNEKYPQIEIFYVDPRDNDFFAKEDAASYTIVDGIHPTQKASEVLAKMVWDVMVENGIEQSDSCE